MRLGLKRKVLDQHHSGMKRIWRLSEVGHTDLILVERITRKAPKVKALYSICLAIVARGLEELSHQRLNAFAVLRNTYTTMPTSFSESRNSDVIPV